MAERHRNDPEHDAVILLSRRALTRRELLARLARRGHPPEEAERAVQTLAERGLIDDLAVAKQHVASRGARRRLGPSRLRLELERRGVAADVARRAIEEAVDDGVLDPARDLGKEVRRRVVALGPRPDRRALARVYNALLRAGFEPEAVRAALEPHFPDHGPREPGESR